jgi:hypothetical protein
MDGGFLYDDGRAALDEDGVTLRTYYFPFGQGKRIPYRDIREVQTGPLTWLTGKGRLWGTSSPACWFPLDLGRPRRNTLVVLDTGRVVKPAFTPDDPTQVKAIIDQRVRPSG